MPTLTKEEIQTRIPHRDPMLLVDKILDYNLEGSIIGTRTFPENDRCFDGHFPDMPLMPGVLMVEAVAQTAAILVSLMEDTAASDVHFLFTGIEKSRFRASIQPNDTIIFDVKLLKTKASIFWFEGVARRGDTICATAAFSAKLVPNE